MLALEAALLQPRDISIQFILILLAARIIKKVQITPCILAIRFIHAMCDCLLKRDLHTGKDAGEGGWRVASSPRDPKKGPHPNSILKQSALAHLSWWRNNAQLLERTEPVRETPMLHHLAIHDTEDVDRHHRDRLACGRDVPERTLLAAM